PSATQPASAWRRSPPTRSPPASAPPPAAPPAAPPRGSRSAPSPSSASAGSGAGGRPDRQQLHVELEDGVGGNRPGAAGSVAHARRHDQAADRARPHAREPLFPAVDHPALAELE